jgi:cardiolipin synthase (CMP-forming)
MFSLPNLLTLSRIAAIPLVVACFWLDHGWAQWVSASLFAIACITDWFDGYFARRYHQISRFGRFLDPIADKLLVAAALVMLVDSGTLKGLNVLAALIILAREILVSGLREFLAELKVSVPVSRVAKWKTTLQLVALGFLIAGPAGETVLPNNTLIGIVLLWVAAVLTIYTGWDYFKNGIHHLMDEG